jgi:hypothetical protein
MKLHFKRNPRLRNKLLTVVLFMLSANAVHASMYDFSFNNNIYNASGVLVGSAPWLDLKIADTTTAGDLLFTVSTLNLTGSQTVTGIFLNIPTAVAATLTGISISNSTNTSAQPLAFVSGTSTSGTSSIFSLTQSITTPALAAGAGSYDLYLKFPVGALVGTISETFDLVFSGGQPTAVDFLTTSLAKNASSPSFVAAAAFTNATGVGASGISVVSASPVPVPAAIWLFGSAIVGFLGFNRRKII